MITSYKSLEKKLREKLIPFHCLFELTYKCNLKCVHCYIVDDRREEIKTNEAFNLLDQLKEAGCLYLTFSGGEIFLRKDFFKIAFHAKKLNFALRLFTNGTLITSKTAEKIKRLKPIAVEISLYGFQNTHDEITQVKDSFSKTIKAIKLLRDRGINVSVKTILLKQNGDQIWDLKKFVQNELKVAWVGIGAATLISPCDDGSKRPLNYRVADLQLKKYIREEFLELKKLNEKFKLLRSKEDDFICAAGLFTCNITPFGELNPCVQIRLKENRIKNKSLLEIYRNHEGFKMIRGLRMKDVKECINCKYIKFCFRCPGIALLEEGSLTSKLPEACRQAELRKKVYDEFFRFKRGNSFL